jgi:hypothetical protein
MVSLLKFLLVGMFPCLVSLCSCIVWWVIMGRYYIWYIIMGRNSVIPSVIYHHQNPSELIYSLVFSNIHTSDCICFAIALFVRLIGYIYLVYEFQLIYSCWLYQMLFCSLRRLRGFQYWILCSIDELQRQMCIATGSSFVESILFFDLSV